MSDHFQIVLVRKYYFDITRLKIWTGDLKMWVD